MTQRKPRRRTVRRRRAFGANAAGPCSASPTTWRSTCGCTPARSPTPVTSAAKALPAPTTCSSTYARTRERSRTRAPAAVAASAMWRRFGVIVGHTVGSGPTPAASAGQSLPRYWYWYNSCSNCWYLQVGRLCLEFNFKEKNWIFFCLVQASTAYNHQATCRKKRPSPEKSQPALIKNGWEYHSTAAGKKFSSLSLEEVF